ncbi:DNA polymerase [Enterococcus phage vB_EfaP_Ef7.3]|uniref:DNA-directed DNA polymerase n=1 Tax=Enterococcus phage vB_EfaP_Ef7.3 TaxID=2546619 RepID=A0A4D6DRV0_9CAUD|nr:DNA polymerase [Enterococcus phage vB_EfaP_Ef7.3]QBZ69060.1 DNA polymerase [Enterococcus phage vB_EfaP_Ef7.3]
MNALLEHAKWLDGTTFEDFERYVKQRKIHQFDCDIETFSYNMVWQKQAPKRMKSRMFTFCASWHEKGVIYTVAFPDFRYFFDAYHYYAKHCNKKKGEPNNKRLKMYLHNGNKFDNHFIAKMIHDVYNADYYNMQDEKSEVTQKVASHMSLKEQENNYILEKRVKGISHLSFSGKVRDVIIEVEDTVMKTGCSLAVCGTMLEAGGFLTKEQLKTTFDYEKYHYQENMSDEKAQKVAMDLYYQLSEEEWTYIQNDTIILSSLRMNFSSVFMGFDFKKATKTQNIINAYTVNNLARYQILGKVITKEGVKTKTHSINYSDYSVNGENFATIIQKFYKGGLNFYNQDYLAKLITEEMISFDINSSYPSIMYEFALPHVLIDYCEEKETVDINTEIDKQFMLYRVKKTTFNRIMSQLDTRVGRQMLVKYFRTVEDEDVYLTSWTFKMLKENFNLNIKRLTVEQWYKFSVKPFGGIEKLIEFYYTKTQGKSKTLVEFKDNNPTKIIFTDKPSERVFTKPEIDISKVNLNGIYGAPALRPTYSIGYRDDDNELHLERNAFHNTERNALTSVFTTGGALWRLTQPFKYLTGKEIDKWFVYCDTDSLYMIKECFNKLPKEMFHPANLGSWDVEHETIEKFYVLNHKKYAYYAENEIQFRCGGVPLDSFDNNMSFEKFIETQFSKGAKVANKRGIYTHEGTVVIYDSVTELDVGNTYPEFYLPEDEKEFIKMIDLAREELKDEDDSDILYLESDLGTLAIKDLWQYEYEETSKDIWDLVVDSREINQILIEN